MVRRGKYTVNSGPKRYTRKRKVLTGGTTNIKFETPYAKIKGTQMEKGGVKPLSHPKNEQINILTEEEYGPHVELANLGVNELPKLQERIEEFKKLSPEEQYRRNFADQLARGKKHGHVHRKLVPSNMFNPNPNDSEWGTVPNLSQIQAHGQEELARQLGRKVTPIFTYKNEKPIQNRFKTLKKFRGTIGSGFGAAKNFISRKFGNLGRGVKGLLTRKNKQPKSKEGNSNDPDAAYRELVGRPEIRVNPLFINSKENNNKRETAPPPPPRQSRKSAGYGSQGNMGINPANEPLPPLNPSTAYRYPTPEEKMELAKRAKKEAQESKAAERMFRMGIFNEIPRTVVNLGNVGESSTDVPVQPTDPAALFAAASRSGLGPRGGIGRGARKGNPPPPKSRQPVVVV